MSLADWDRDNCSVARALELIGDRHTVLVLREAFVGERRFDRIQRHTGVARNLLSDRLNKLVAHGILTRRPYQERPVRHEYVLTEKGLDLYPVLVSLMQWGMRHGGGDTPIVLQHKGCGAVVDPHLACPECGEAVGARDMRALPGPDAVLRQTA
jgi:DNA-binding HxlR family transcriptional regulator